MTTQLKTNHASSIDWQMLSEKQWRLIEVLTNIINSEIDLEKPLEDFVLNTGYSFRIRYDMGLLSMRLLDDLVNKRICNGIDTTEKELLYYIQKDFELITNDHNALSCLGDNLYNDRKEYLTA